MGRFTIPTPTKNAPQGNISWIRLGSGAVLLSMYVLGLSGVNAILVLSDLRIFSTSRKNWIKYPGLLQKTNDYVAKNDRSNLGFRLLLLPSGFLYREQNAFELMYLEDNAYNTFWI